MKQTYVLKDIYWAYINSEHTNKKLFFPFYYDGTNIQYINNKDYFISNELKLGLNIAQIKQVPTHQFSQYTFLGTLTIIHAPYLYMAALKNCCFTKLPKETNKFITHYNCSINTKDFVEFISQEKLLPQKIFSYKSPFLKALSFVKSMDFSKGFESLN